MSGELPSPAVDGLRRRRPADLPQCQSSHGGESAARAVDLSPASSPVRKESTFSDKVRVDEELQVMLDEQDVPMDGSKRKPAADEKRGKTKPTRLRWWEFIWLELTRGYSLENHHDRYTEKRRKVYAFCLIPFELEKFLFFGFRQCLDAFCHVFTFLPIRFMMAVLGKILGIRTWTAAETCDFLKISIIFASSVVMHCVNTSMLYHMVRGQSVIKLYILSSMLEVADKLFSSFGQDILEALFWTASERGGKRKLVSTLFHWVASIVYACLHSLLVLLQVGTHLTLLNLQATTLNVAFNSHNQSLLTIMMSNNFVELKGSVFKKFAKPNLFQMSCSDCRERFHIVVLLVVVVLRNMTAVNWKFEHLDEMVPDLFMVVFAELLVDWLKHAFITKFNEINTEVYQDFTITLAFDVVRSHEKETFMDFSDQVSRRMGFIPIPIAIMLITVISQSIDFTSKVYTAVFVSIWCLLLAIKVVNGLSLHAKGVWHVDHFRALQRQAESEVYRKRVLSAKSKSAPSSPKMSLIDFTDILTQATRVPARGFTVSDVLAELERLPAADAHRCQASSAAMTSAVADTADTPRRSVSMVDLPTQPPKRRDNSLPPLNETDEPEAKEPPEPPKDPGLLSPKRRLDDCAELNDVQAYQLLEGRDNVQEIRS